MPTPRFRDKLAAGSPLLGLTLTYPAPGLIEGMARGWDFIWIDGQHGEMDYRAAVAALRTCDSLGLASLLRVPTHDAGLMGMYADAHPSAVMVPMVNNAADARHVADALRFAPLGKRSYGGRRVIDLLGREYCKTPDVEVVVQIETLEAIANLDAIVRTPGIDGVFFGPDDMKLQMGIEINTSPIDHPRLLDAMRRTAEAARAAGLIVCGVAPTAAALKAMTEMGYQVLAGGADIGLLRAATAAKLAELRGSVPPTLPRATSY